MNDKTELNEMQWQILENVRTARRELDAADSLLRYFSNCPDDVQPDFVDRLLTDISLAESHIRMFRYGITKLEADINERKA